MPVKSFFIFPGFGIIGPQDFLAYSDYFYSHLFHLDAFHIAFPTGYYLHTNLMALGACPVVVGGRKNSLALPTAYLGRLGFKRKRGAFGDGVPADSVEIK